MKDIILQAFSEIDFVNRYKEICDAYTDFDNGKSFKRVKYKIIAKTKY